jgi:hypothetical protein
MAGLFGAALAHALTVLAARHGAAEWLHGPFGPPFFSAALYTGVFYGAIGAAAGKRAAAAGFLGGLLGLLVPLYVLTRYGGWTAEQWRSVTLACYIVAIWGTIAGIGALSRPQAWRGAVAAVLGSFAAYAVLAGCIAIFKSLRATGAPDGFAAPAVNLLDGLLSGAGLCLALSLDGRLSRRTS